MILIEELEMKLAELIAISSWWKQDIHTDFKALKRSDTPGYFLNDQNIGMAKELENALVVLCRNSIIHIVYKQYKTLAIGKTDIATSTTATNAKSKISNTSLTSAASASDSTTSYLINANNITVCS